MPAPDATILDALFARVASRQGADPASSYTAKLLSEGVERIARKLGEEALETLIEALKRDPERVAAESADLLDPLLVLWVATGVAPEQVWRILEGRQGVSGLAEKAARKS